MMNFVFSIPTQIQFGAGASSQAGAVTKSLLTGNKYTKAGEVLVVVDPGIREANWLTNIFASLDEHSLGYQIFDKVRPNPRDVDVDRATSLIKEKNLEAIPSELGEAAQSILQKVPPYLPHTAEK